MIKWIMYFVCGLIGSIIYNKVRFKKDENSTKCLLGEFLIFIWGYIGLFTVLFTLAWKRVSKN